MSQFGERFKHGGSNEARGVMNRRVERGPKCTPTGLDAENPVWERKTWLLTSFCPVVSGTTLAKDKVVRAEKTTERARSNSVHSSRLEIDQNSAGNILVRASLVVID